MQIGKAAVLGATGVTGREIVRELVRRQIPVRAVSRRAGNLERDFGNEDAVERVVADLTDPGAVLRATGGCDLLFHCVGLPLAEMHLHPEIAGNVAAAAKATGARVMLITGYWAYSPVKDLPITEFHLREPRALKCAYRKQQEDRLAEAGAAIVCLPDFYGPGVGREASILNAAVLAVAEGRKADWPGNADAKRDFLYVPDLGPPAVELATRDLAYGQRWNFDGSGPMEPRRLLDLAGEVVGRPARVRVNGALALALVGIFSPTVRQFRELLPLYSRPAFLCGKKLGHMIGEFPRTSYEDGIRALIGRSREAPPADRPRE